MTREERLLRNRRGGLAVGNPHRWGDTLDGLTVLLDEIRDNGLRAVLEEADERGVEGRDLRHLLLLLRGAEALPA